MKNNTKEDIIAKHLDKIRRSLRFFSYDVFYIEEKDGMDYKQVTKDLKKILELEGYYVRVKFLSGLREYMLRVFSKSMAKSKYLEDFPGKSSGFFDRKNIKKFREKHDEISSGFWYTDYKPPLVLDEVLLSGNQEDIENLKIQLANEYLRGKYGEE